MKKKQEIDNFSYIISIEQIKREIEYEFHLVCSKDALRELPKRLNVIEAKKASFNGRLKLQLANQIFLFGTVQAKLIQPCSITLEPVVTIIYKRLARTFFIGTNEYKPMKKSVFELTEKSFDTDIILDEINLGDVLMETISLETPDYPKKSGASISSTRTESIDRENPFSVLSKLKK